MENYMMTRGWQNPTIQSQPQQNNQERKLSTNSPSQPNTGYSVGGGFVKEVNPGGSSTYYGAGTGANQNVGGNVATATQGNTGRSPYNAEASNGKGFGFAPPAPSNSNSSNNSNNSSNPSNPNNNPWWMQPFAYGGPGNNFYGGNSPGGNPAYLNPFMGGMMGFPGMGFGMGGFGGLNPYSAMFGGGFGGGMFSNPFASFGAGSGIGGGLNPYSGMYGVGNQFGNSFGGMTSDFGQNPFGGIGLPPPMSESAWNNRIEDMSMNPNKPKTYQEYLAQHQQLGQLYNSPIFSQMGGMFNNGLLGSFF